MSRPASPDAFHRTLDGYRPTPLVEAPRTAARLGLEHLLVKDESYRFDLGAYKILGASWAAYLAVSLNGATELVAASEGNYGRAVARAARWFQASARIFMSNRASAGRIEKIRREGAEVVLVDGDYDRAVEEARRYAETAGGVFLSDTGITGEEESPRRVVEGYSTLFHEIDTFTPRPDALFVQIGVGSLAAAAVCHYQGSPTCVTGVEPAGADCVRQSRAAGRIVTVDGPYDPRMAGLNCGRPSATAWPALAAGLSDAVAIDPDLAAEAVQWLAEDGIFTTPAGAAGVAGIAMGKRPHGTVVAIATEGTPRP